MQGSGANGVVLFSMGATFDASIAPPALTRSLLNAFSRLRQRVLMKVSGALPADIQIPANVRVERWLPQQDILGESRKAIFLIY
jgi:UDP:flavonoid glycosyltransferase YjiC (YdhE family)